MDYFCYPYAVTTAEKTSASFFQPISLPNLVYILKYDKIQYNMKYDKIKYNMTYDKIQYDTNQIRSNQANNARIGDSKKNNTMQGCKYVRTHNSGLCLFSPLPN